MRRIDDEIGLAGTGLEATFIAGRVRQDEAVGLADAVVEVGEAAREIESRIRS
jgi:hypothetical protein